VTAGRGAAEGARLDGRARYAVIGHPGVWRYVGQAVFVGDDGRDVEHDYVRMAPVGQDEPEVWVDPADCGRIGDASTSAA
jgi:hypothetical protein